MWISYATDTVPTSDPAYDSSTRPWANPKHIPNLTATRAAFKTFNTYVQSEMLWFSVYLLTFTEPSQRFRHGSLSPLRENKSGRRWWARRNCTYALVVNRVRLNAGFDTYMLSIYTWGCQCLKYG